MKKTLVTLFFLAACAFLVFLFVRMHNREKAREEALAGLVLPGWIETDSLEAIHARLLYDFPWTVDEARPVLRDRYPELTDADIDRFIELKYIETLTIDDTLRVHRKAPRNLRLLNPQMSGFTGRNDSASAARIACVDTILAWKRGTLPTGGARRIEYRFTVEVPFDSVLVGQKLRAWLPLPLDSTCVDYQSDVRILSTSQPDYTLSADAANRGDAHSSIYMEAMAPEQPGDTTVFSYTGSYIAQARYFSPEYILANMQPYDTSSELYRRYTSFDGPHYIRLDSLAAEIVGSETNPLRQSQLVFDYIQDRYPWAGAREYSTIGCMPQYVVEQGHGDCGQVALLYISLMRTLGVPARWISGWMAQPGDTGWHDWGATYFEGIGWVPVDVSFGRMLNAQDPDAKRFYNTGIDSWRMCINPGVGLPMVPAKRFIRSETVDFQAGEVECDLGNIFYGRGWDSDLEIISVTPVVINR